MHRLLVTTAFALGFAVSALAADVAEVGDLVIHHPWVRASIGNTRNSAAYMMLEVTGDAADRLVAAATPLAARAELHAHLMEGGVARMRPVDAIEVAPGAPTVLEPGSLHIMITGLTERLEDGATMPLTLTFENAGEVVLDVPIRGMGRDMGHGSHGSGDQGSHQITN